VGLARDGDHPWPLGRPNDCLAPVLHSEHVALPELLAVDRDRAVDAEEEAFQPSGTPHVQASCARASRYVVAMTSESGEPSPTTVAPSSSAVKSSSAAASAYSDLAFFRPRGRFTQGWSPLQAA